MTRIPSHLRGNRMHGGLPVPDVVSSTKGHHELCASSWNGADLMTYWFPENDSPDFGKYDDEKQRLHMARKTCHVCTRASYKASMVLVDPQRRKRTDGQQMLLDGRLHPLISQPWVCVECLRFAVDHCPPLKTAIEEKRGLVFYPIKTQLVLTYWQPVGPNDPVPPEGSTVLSYLKIAVLLDRRCVDLHEWVAARRLGVSR